MMLKNIFGKTIEAAKKSARQMYGDDFLVVESSEENEDSRGAKITIFSDAQRQEKNNGTPQQQFPHQNRDNDMNAGVKFERSPQVEDTTGNGARPAGSDKLNSLRKYAEELARENRPNGESNGHHEQNNAFKNTYSRAVIRSVNPVHEEDDLQKEDVQETDKPVAEERKPLTAVRKPAEGKFITHFKPSAKAKAVDTEPSQASVSSKQNQLEIKALHKRFDKLEALLDSAIISANLDYASHPAFQQLVQTGINTSVIANWFSKIIQQGIDPFEQEEQFMAELGKIIRKALGKPALEEPQKYLLFVGPSGTGKTSLIMKLSQHPDLFFDKKIALVSVHPQKNTENTYYTILEPFCRDHDLPYFEIKNSRDVNELMTQWEDFDHVLIDTPSINVEQENSFRDFWKIRQMLTPLTPLEVHYVVNASLNRFYFQNSTATHHPLQPDYVAITHLDEVSHWGPVIPFLQEMGCNARFISRGENLSNSVTEFNPQWFAQKILQDS